MTYKNFRIQIVLRALVLAAAAACTFYFFLEGEWMAVTLMVIIIISTIYGMVHFTESTNRKLTFFLESIENSDFTVKFSRDNKYGRGFQKLNLAFNRVLGAFREVRAEKEAHLQYLHTVVQYVSIGLISFDPEGKVGLINNAAVKLLGIGYIRNISELKAQHGELLEILNGMKPGQNRLLKRSLGNRDFQISINATELRLRGTAFKLVSLTNIQSELQQTEVEAWQNLAKVLRHEIMNSITPIVSHVETLNEMIGDSLSWTPDKQFLTPETTKDLTNALGTIEKRSKGLLHFVDAYRSFSEIPTPAFKIISVGNLFERLIELYQGEIKKRNISTTVTVDPQNLEINADQELIDTVLINLFKNALQAVQDKNDAVISLIATMDERSRVIFRVEDNGSGIIPEAQEKIFIPFFTTKENGSGIGLSLSRQIMQMHHGNLSVDSQPGRTVFIMQF
ncbi:MAG: sensor histidine kinase [Cyclobacteriaceae bacterium]|nr:MAG: sensor histidine kinase [Cyclobacteriaceae bacterium]